MKSNIHNYFTIVCNNDNSDDYWLEVKDGVAKISDRFVIIPLAGDDYIVVGNKRYLLSSTNTIKSISRKINLVDLYALEQQIPLLHFNLNSNINSYGVYKDFRQLRNLAKSEFQAADNSYPVFSQYSLENNSETSKKFQVFTNIFLNDKRIADVVTIDDNAR